jgi:adenylate cyclase
MNEFGQSRKLAAILAADVAGYSRLMGDDEKATVHTLTEYRQVFTEHINRHRGHLVDTAGDSVLATFDSPVEAVECAVEIQRELARRNRHLADDRRMNFRIGINLGDVISSEDGTVYGDGVNIAARLESLAEPGGITVSGTVCEYVENKLPVSFDFTGEQSVKNIAKPVRAFRVGMDWVAASQAAIHAPPTRQRRSKRHAWMLGMGALFLIAIALGAWQAARVRHSAPSSADPVIAVLAFANMSADPKQEYFSDGLTENIIDSLAQVRNLKVIARNSSFRYKGQTVDVRKVGEELGAKYIVEGSVRRSADTVRVTAQLVESGHGSHLWSKTYDRALTAKNVFAIQDEIATAITSTLAGFYGVLRQEDLALAKHKPPSELGSYDCVLLGMGYYRGLSLQTFRAARDCAEKAIKVEADYAPLLGLLAAIYRGEFQFGYDPRPGSLDRSVDAAQRAIRIDPTEADYHVELALSHFLRGELEAFKAEANRAIELSPMGSSSFGNLGIYFWYAGEYEKGHALTEKAKALDPYFPGWYRQVAFHDHYRSGRYDAALAEANKQNMPDYVHGYSLLVAAYGQLNRVDEAKPYIARIREIDPTFDARKHWTPRFHFQPEYLELLLDGMRKGGLKVSEKNGQKNQN